MSEFGDKVGAMVAGMNLNQFMSDERTIFGVCYGIHVVGEAGWKLSEELKKRMFKRSARRSRCSISGRRRWWRLRRNGRRVFREQRARRNQRPSQRGRESQTRVREGSLRRGRIMDAILALPPC